MHEFELGIWKAIFIHILRLLVALGGDAIQEFDSRSVKYFYGSWFMVIDIS